MDFTSVFGNTVAALTVSPTGALLIVHSYFKRNQLENLKDLARFFKEYAPRYGYKYLCTEDDDYKYYSGPWFETYS